MNWSTFNVPGCTKTWKEFKTYRKNGGESSFSAWATERSKSLTDPAATVAYLSHMAALHALRIKGCAHYFIDRDVCEFSRTSVKEFSEVYRDDTFFSCLPLALHFPSSEQQNSWMVLPDVDPFFCCVVGCSLETGAQKTGLYRIRRIGDLSATTLEACIEREIDQIWRLLFGLSLYVRAFPECVNEMQTNPMPWLQGTRRMIGRHAIIEEEESRSVLPHFRRGHFRVLQSERYHEPGKVVFVKGTFVKGRAYHVKGAEVGEAA